MDEQEIKQTDLWLLYERGVSFNRLHDIYSDVDRCNRFYNGDQWAGLKSGGVEPVSFNIIKPIVKYKVGTINQNLWAINYSNDNFLDQDNKELLDTTCKMLNKRADQVFEKDNMDYKLRRFSKQAAINGEAIIYVNYDDDADDPTNELLSITDICYGNENSSSIQEQPYIIIKSRKPVSAIQKMARDAGVKESDLELIKSDNETSEQAGELAKDEVNDMCIILTKMYKKDGKVLFSKSTRYLDIETDKDSGLTYYPLTHMLWEEVEGSARGIGEVKYLIPNQIEVNKTIMRRAITVKQTAYPQKVALVDKIQNPEALTEVGSIIKVLGMNTTDARQILSYTSPAQMSTDASQLEKELISTTRELEGAGDIATGSVNPEDASGKAILAVQQASQQPLTEQVLSLKTAIEDLGRIYIDMWRIYAKNGLQVSYDDTDANNQIVQKTTFITKDTLNKLKAKVKVDITPKSSYDRFAVEQSLENLFLQQKITFEEYVKALPDDSVMPKKTLEIIVENRRKAQKQIASIQQQANSLMNNGNQQIANAEDAQSTIQNIQQAGNEIAQQGAQQTTQQTMPQQA